MTGVILILNGPNLNMLGTREPGIYGASTLADIGKMCTEACKKLGYLCDFRQSNHEGELVTWAQAASQTAEVKGVIINAGAYTHTSVALHDSLRLLSCPVAEVHLSNPMAREGFRHTSYVAPLAFASICGLGPQGYIVAIEGLAKKLTN